MSSINIQNISITKLETDAIVNAANSGLSMGGGVCGCIYFAAGVEQMAEACGKIGFCDRGSAVITPGFNLPAKYVIHAVGPKWRGGNEQEPELLYSAYNKSLSLAKENGIHSIGFPLISAGRFHYPLEQAWEIAIKACRDFIDDNSEYELKIIFAVMDERIITVGKRLLKQNKEV